MMAQNVVTWLKTIVEEATKKSLSKDPEEVLIEHYRDPHVQAKVRIDGELHDVELDVRHGGSFYNFKLIK